MKKYPYETLAITLTVALPLLSTVIYWYMHNNLTANAFFVSLATWTVFWGIGVHLLVAGISQVFKPNFTAQSILGNKTDSANQIVRELGFANVGMGLAGVLSLWVPGLVFGAALIGGIFMGLAGVEHLRKSKRNVKENVAMVTDLFVAIIALSFVSIALYYFFSSLF